jgi:hypothetical protein
MKKRENEKIMKKLLIFKIKYSEFSVVSRKNFLSELFKLLFVGF